MVASGTVISGVPKRTHTHIHSETLVPLPGNVKQKQKQNSCTDC